MELLKLVSEYTEVKKSWHLAVYNDNIPERIRLEDMIREIERKFDLELQTYVRQIAQNLLMDSKKI